MQGALGRRLRGWGGVQGALKWRRATHRVELAGVDGEAGGGGASALHQQVVHVLPQPQLRADRTSSKSRRGIQTELAGELWFCSPQSELN